VQGVVNSGDRNIHDGGVEHDHQLRGGDHQQGETQVFGLLVGRQFGFFGRHRRFSFSLGGQVLGVL
jgi:hypothetical protein